jgi:arylformamidase
MMLYKHYSQEQLNDQYNTRLQVPGYAGYFEHWEQLSRHTERKYTVIKNISYGTRPEECLDIFPAEKPLSKTLVFIHGGFWHLLDKTMFHFLAETFSSRQVSTVFINYPLAPAVSMDQIVLSMHSSMRWLHKNLERFNGNPSEIYGMGHSAGGHLACMLAVAENMKFLSGLILLSGLFRLEPLMLSNLNTVLGMDAETALRNSPVLLEPRSFCPLLLAFGTDETDEFKNQSLDLFESWKNKQAALKLMKVKGKNHYSILDAVTEKDSPLQSEIFHFMNI